MFITNISLNHYRNYEQIYLNLNPNVNIFIGSNAQGKTNLLEAIFVMAMTKSHRTYKDKELIQWNHSNALIHCEVDKKYGKCQLDLNISAQGKAAKINGLEQKKLSHFIGSLNAVMFAPEDLEIVKGAPSIRRRFMDMEIAQMQSSYLHNLLQYQKILMQRNNYLKQLQFKQDNNHVLLEIWDRQLVEYGVKIIKKRQNFIKKLQEWAEKIHSSITNHKEQLRIVYDPSFEISMSEDESVLFDQFMIKLSQVKEQELKRGVSLAGPHRDDLTFFINDKEVQTYGSQGQQRTAALSLKLAEIELIQEETGEYPVLLLDDVLSELDSYRQTQLIETFQNKVQTFITTTGIESVNLAKIPKSTIFQVNEGQATQNH
ncbi:MAG TPA: DNA replication/repair protein RecF [Bacilli bacterium]